MTKSIHIEQITNNQPFCAGVVAFYKSKLVVTLNHDGIPQLKDLTLRIGAVGGGQESGETILECARREAAEELSTQKIDIIHAALTYFHDMDNDQIQMIKSLDQVAPFLFQRQTNPMPTTPYKPGLPTGPYIYYNIFLGKLTDIPIFPGDDVAALLLVPLEKWELLQKDNTLGYILDHGVDLICEEIIDKNTKLYLPPDESLNTVIPLLRKHSELLEMLS